MTWKDELAAKYDAAERRERKCLTMAVDNHPHLSNLILTDIGAFTSNDGWLTSAVTLHITAEIKIRCKYTNEEIYIDTNKHHALMSMASIDGSTPMLFDFCVKDRAMLVVDLSLPGVIFSAATKWHKFKKCPVRKDITVYPRTSIVDTFPLSLWLPLT